MLGNPRIVRAAAISAIVAVVMASCGISDDGPRKKGSPEPPSASNGTTTAPSLSAEPTSIDAPTSAPTDGCNPLASSASGDFDGNGDPDRATLSREVCSEAEADGFGYVISLEWGPASGSWSLPDCRFGCRLIAAPDVDGDGADELAVSLEAFSILDVAIYSAPPVEVGPTRIPLMGAGDPGGGFLPDSPPGFSLGGDAFWSYALRCDEEAGRVLVQVQGETKPHDGPEAKWHVRETWLRLVDNDPSTGIAGTFVVLRTETFVIPTGAPEADALFGGDDRTLCGVPVTP
jgi:hypothetical protein